MQDKENQIQQIRKEKLQNLLQNAFNALKGILTTAFSGGEQKPSQELFHYNCMLNMIWEEILAAQVCTTLDELDTFFANMRQNITQRIMDYHANNRLTFAIPKTLEGIFQALISCCQEMIKQKYLFLALDEATETKEDIQSLKNLLAALADDLLRLYQFDQENSLEQFIESLKMIKAHLAAIGYGSFTPDADEEIRGKQNYPSYIALGQQLRRLPTTSALNALVESLHQSLDTAPHAKIEAGREELRKRIIIIKEVRDKLFKSLLAALQQHDKTLAELEKYIKPMSVTVKKIDEVYGRIETQHRIFSLLSPFMQIDKLIQACDNHRHAMNETFIMRNKKQIKQVEIWINATQDMMKLQRWMDRQYDNIIANHSYLFKRYPAIKRENCQLHKKFSYVNELAERFRQVTSNSRNVLETIKVAFELIINTLGDHVKCTSEYMRDFLKHHGLKMVLGGVGGIGLSIIVGVVVAASPASIAVLATGGMLFGTGCGGLAGWSADYWHDKKIKSKPPQSAETISSKSINIRPSFFSPRQKLDSDSEVNQLLKPCASLG